MAIFNLAIDGYSAVLCAVLALYVLVVDDRRNPVNLCFVGICAANVVMTLGDMTSWLWQPPLDATQYVVLLVGSFLFWVMPAPMFLCFTGYIVSYLRRRTAVPKGYLTFSVVLFALYLAGCVASLFNGMFFQVTPDAGYVRGDFFYLGQVVPIVLHARNGLIVVRYCAYLSTKERLSFLAYILLPFIAEAVQAPLFGVALMNTAVAFATLVVFMNIQASHRAELAEREKELAEARGDIMLSQIQPHFLYNTLTAIRELCLTDPSEAASMVTRFSRFLRENMASLTSKEPIAFERELKHVETYLELEKRRFGDRLSVKYDIRCVDFSCPPLVVQPLAENAVRHGATKRVEGGTVTISSYEDEESFVVTVQDDGMGFDASPLDNGQGGRPMHPVGEGAHQHVGLRNVSLRLREACNASLEVRSELGKGTVACIRIPKSQAVERVLGGEGQERGRNAN